MEKIKTLYRNDHEEHSSQGQPQTFPAMATTNFPQSDTLQVTSHLILHSQTLHNLTNISYTVILSGDLGIHIGVYQP